MMKNHKANKNNSSSSSSSQKLPEEAVLPRNSLNHLPLTVLLPKFQLMRSFLEEIALISFLVLTI